MKVTLDILPSELREVVHQVSREGERLRVSVYLVGGIVRDVLLKRPNLDLDFVVEGDGIVFADAVAHTLQGTVRRHRRFGTATVMAGQFKVDIASARTEQYHASGSLPTVTFASLKEDLFRRDFTVNAMARDIDPHRFGRLIDYYGGYDDLKAGRIRFMHARSFLDDPTRIFRAIRFKERFKFAIEKKTFKHLKEAVDSDALSYVHVHRIRDELMLLLEEPSPHACFSRVQRWCGFDFVHPGYSFSAEAAEVFKQLGRSVSWYEACMHQHKLPRIQKSLVYLCAFAGGLSARDREAFGARYGFRRHERDMLNMIGNVDTLCRSLHKASVSPSGVYKIVKPLPIEMIVLLHARSGHYPGRLRIRSRLEEYLKRYRDVHLTLKGEDLKKLKIQPQLLYNTILTQLLYRKLDGYIHTQDDETTEALRLFKRLTRSEGRRNI